jgi:hypothetical protein
MSLSPSTNHTMEDTLDLTAQNILDTPKEETLAKHCRSVTSGSNQKPDEHLIKMLRNAYRRGVDLALDYKLLPIDFQTQKVWDALQAIQKKPPVPGRKR